MPRPNIMDQENQIGLDLCPISKKRNRSWCFRNWAGQIQKILIIFSIFFKYLVLSCEFFYILQFNFEFVKNFQKLLIKFNIYRIGLKWSGFLFELDRTYIRIELKLGWCLNLRFYSKYHSIRVCLYMHMVI